MLVVDDDPLIAGMLRLVLEGAGYEVREADDGRAALASMRAELPSAVVLDLLMPEVDGYGVLEALRASDLGAGTRVIMLTCCSEEDQVRRCLRLGADEYLTKPVDVDSLVRTVGELVSMDMDEVRRRRAEAARPRILDERVRSALGRHASFCA